MRLKLFILYKYIVVELHKTTKKTANIVKDPESFSKCPKLLKSLNNPIRNSTQSWKVIAKNLQVTG